MLNESYFPVSSPRSTQVDMPHETNCYQQCEVPQMINSPHAVTVKPIWMKTDLYTRQMGRVWH